MQKITFWVFMFACMELYPAVEVSEKKVTANDRAQFYVTEVSEKKVTADDGSQFDVIEVVDDHTDIVIMKKDGVILEQQITRNEQDYVITLLNNTCNVEFQDQENLPTNNTCYEGRKPAEHEITDNIKTECGEAEIRFIEAVECQKDHIQKRGCFVLCYYRYVCRIVWWRKYMCCIVKRCYFFCF